MILYTQTNKELSLKTLSCAETIKLIAPINPKLANILKRTDDNYTFYHASYRFGDTIVAQGKCYLPLTNGGNIDINDAALPEQIKQDLSYDPKTEDPLLLFLNRKSESYKIQADKISSHSIIHAGQMLGIPRAVRETNDKILGSALSWDLNAGSRTLFMLTPISDKRSHTKLQEHFNTKLDAPEAMREHWQTFAELARRADSPWRCEVIYFPRKLIKHIHDDKSVYLLAELNHIRQTAYNVWHNLSANWGHAFSDIELRRGLINYSPCALATAKHMFMIGADSAIGFRPAINEDSAPIKFLQNAYANIYGLTQQKHSAVIMEPGRFSWSEDTEPIYYSINYYVFRQNDPEASKRKSHITLLEEIRTVQTIFINEIGKSYKNVESLYNVVRNLQFNYYHANRENHPDILDINLLAKEDKRFSLEQNGEFPVNSPFFKGCIRIAV